MKKTDYDLLIQQAEALTKDCPHTISNFANISALLFLTLEDINWAGFYFVEDFLPDLFGHRQASADAYSQKASTPANKEIFADGRLQEAVSDSTSKLILGPFQGNPACIEIPLGKGVCGTAAAEDRTQLVPDVHQFPGHIACDSASRSEIVIPIHKSCCPSFTDSLSSSQDDCRVIGVLDIDSPFPARFTEEDKEGLEQLVALLEKTAVTRD